MKLLEKDNSVSIHQENLQILADEMCKVSKDITAHYASYYQIKK